MVCIIVEVLSSLLMVLHSSSGEIYFLSIAIMGLSYSFVYYVAMVGLLAETRRERMGAGAGIFENSIGMGSFVGPVIAGSVAGNSLTIPFIVPSICAIPILGYLIKEARSTCPFSVIPCSGRNDSLFGPEIVPVNASREVPRK